MSAEVATEWAGENMPAPQKPQAQYPGNDTERAARFAELFGGELRYVYAWNKWVFWDGFRWAPDIDGEVFRKAQELSSLFLREASEMTDFDLRKKAAGLAIRAGDRTRIEAMVSLARCRMACSPTLFDSDPMLLGVSNGVVDLQTGFFRPARKEDYIIKQATPAYDPDATCPTWEKFLLRIFGQDTELVSFIQRAIGYSLTGCISEQCLFFLFGTGSNGKSTLAECLQELFGAYALKTSSSLYTLDKHGREPSDAIARLVGKRFVTGSETEEGDDLAESRVKDITGGDTLTGRELYCPAFNFKPSHKLWIYGNHRPDVRGNDHGIWRRIKLVPFQVQISGSEKDPDLGKKLRQEHSGILNWAIKGCLDWQRAGLGEARAVVEATTSYREDEDELGEFINEMCWEEGEVERKALYRTFKVWAEDRGNRYVPKQATFSKRIGERAGIKPRKSGKQRYWTGISVRTSEELLPGGTLRVSLSGDSGSTTAYIPHPSRNTRLGHLGQENTSFPETSSYSENIEKFGEIR
jgi:putative DNA primase/helicase